MKEKLQILVLEDNPGDYFLLREYLTLLGSNFSSNLLHVNNLHKFSQLEESAIPDVIFADLHLPDSDGLETLHAVMKKFPLTAIIILSGNTNVTTALQAIQAGAQDFILKSDFNERLLEKTLQYSIERKQNQLKLEESNLRYEMISKATMDVIWDYNITTSEITWNENVQSYGYHTSINKNLSWKLEKIHPDDRVRVSKRLHKHLNGKEVLWHEQYRFCCADGSYKYIRDRACIIRNANNQSYRMIGTMEDVTEQIELQERIELERKIIENEIYKAIIIGQEKEKDEIGRELHDNINQLLSVSKLYLGLAKSSKHNVQEMIDKSGVHIDNAINEIRLLTHSLVAPTIENNSIDTILKPLIQEFELAGKITVKLFDETSGSTIESNKLLTFYRIIQEQFTNIQKYAQANAVNITFKVENGIIILTIKDDGVGFDTTTVKTGIGLRNIQNRVKAYSGNMTIYSEVGKGCQLEASIPL